MAPARNASPRSSRPIPRCSDGPFVTLNCGALPSELIEAELFGADAGAYTGASKAREGKFEAADGGTLFLDEIGNLPLAGQMKLLRVLETGRFERLGSNRERQVSGARDQRHQCRPAGDDPRRQLPRRPVLPPQRHRAAPAAAGRASRRHPAAGASISSPDGQDAGRSARRPRCSAHAWPGNVRELQERDAAREPAVAPARRSWPPTSACRRPSRRTPTLAGRAGSRRDRSARWRARAAWSRRPRPSLA